MITLEYSERKLTREELAAFQANRNIHLPATFATLYLRYNGGVPGENVFTDEDGDEFIVAKFFPILYGSETIEYVSRTLQIDESILPKHLMPFGRDAFGNIYCLDIKDANGEVFCAYMDSGEPIPVVKVADSFDVLLSNMQEMEE